MLKTFSTLFRLCGFIAYTQPLMLTLTDEVLAWELWLVDQQGYDIHHSKNSGRWARRWVEHAGDKLTPASCVTWLSDMSMGRKLSPQTIRNRMSICKQFCGFLLVMGRIQSNPWISIPAPRGRAGVGADALTQDEVNRLIDAAERAARHPDGRIRNNANARAVLYRLLNGTGMRWGEWRSQRWDDIFLNSGSLQVTKDKSRRRDALPLSESVVATLKSWRQISLGETVFEDYPTQKGLDRDMKSCGIQGRGKWHRMRVGFVTNAFEIGLPVELIQRLVRHRSCDMTNKYLRHKNSTLKAGLEKISQFGKDSALQALDKAKQPCSDAHVFKPSTTNNAVDECPRGGFGLEHLNPRGDSHSLQSDANRAGGICNASPIDRLIHSIDRLVDQIRNQNEQGLNIRGSRRGCNSGNGSASRIGREDRSDKAVRGEATPTRSDGDSVGDRKPTRRCNQTP